MASFALHQFQLSGSTDGYTKATISGFCIESEKRDSVWQMPQELDEKPCGIAA
jgi:hypothetical protein